MGISSCESISGNSQTKSGKHFRVSDSGTVIEDSLFIIGYALLLLYIVLFNSMLRIYIPFKGKWSLVSCAFFLLSEILVLRREGIRGYFSEKATRFGICAIALSALVTFSCGSSTPLILCTCAFCVRRIPFDTVARAALWTISLACLLTVACSMLGVVDDVVWVQGSRVRHGLGMRYTTTLSHYVFYCTLLYLFIKRCRLRVVDTAIIASIDTAVFLLTNSRNSFSLTLAALAISWLVQIAGIKKCGSAFRYLVASIVPFFAVASIVLMIIYSPNSAWQAKLNKTLGGRLEISHRSYQLYGIPVFGQDQEFVGQGIEEDGQKREGPVTVIDNSYCNMLITTGFIFTVLVLSSLTLLMWRLASRDSITIIIIIGLVALHSLIDPQLLTIQFDVPLLLIGCCLIGDADHRDKTFIMGKPLHQKNNESLGSLLLAALIAVAIISPAVFVYSLDLRRPSQGIKASFFVESRGKSSDEEQYHRDVTASEISYNNLYAMYPESDYLPGELHAVWVGNLSPLTSGEYEFAVSGSGTIRVLLDGIPLFELKESSSQDYVQSSDSVEMRAGSYHAIYVEWENINDDDSLILYWRTVDNTEWHVIPYNCFSVPDDN